MSRQSDIQQLIINNSRRLQLLKEKQALQGLNTPPETLIEIENIELELDDLETELRDLTPQTGALSDKQQVFEQRNRERLLEKVENFWVNRVFRNSLHGVMFIELGMEYKSEAIERPWDMILQQANYVEHTSLPRDKKIVDVFHDVGGKLLILGAPGSGKTTTLLELARDLIASAKLDNNLPIPVVFNLSSWADERNSISNWLVNELYDKYQVPQKIGQTWVDNDRLLLLLDGLDEVKQQYQVDCVEALNHYQQEHVEAKIVVCSRSADYEILTTHLTLHDAVTLQSLKPQQIDNYLASAGEQLNGVRELLQVDETLQELAKSPLMLSIMIIVYRGQAADSLPTFNSIKERHNHMLDSYVRRMFERRGVTKEYSQEQTVFWLSWLAKKMAERTQSIFLIEKMQPDWLPAREQRRLYDVGLRLIVSLTFGLIIGVATGVAAGLLFGQVFGVSVGLAFGIAWGLASWLTLERAFGIVGILTTGLAFGVAWGLAGWLAFGGIPAIMIGLVGALAGGLGFGFGVKWLYQTGRLALNPDRIVTVEILSLSWSKAMLSMIVWLALGIPIGLINGVPIGFIAGATMGWAYGIATTLAFVMTFGVAGGLTSGEIETKIVPNQGIRRSVRNANLIGGAFGLIIFLVMGLSIGLALGLASGLLAGVAVGLAGWLVGWTLFGGLAYTQHSILRLILSNNGFTPQNYARFLDYATERIFLRKVGGGYIFIHRILLDYFATLDSRTFFDQKSGDPLPQMD